MDGFPLWAVIFLVACYGHTTLQMVDEEADISENRVDTLNITTTTEVPEVDGTIIVSTIDTEAINCTTAKGVSGSCVPRQMCDYSTTHIDLTLYAGNGYVKICTTEQVCCPFDSQLERKPQTLTADDFDFDDDD